MVASSKFNQSTSSGFEAREEEDVKVVVCGKPAELRQFGAYAAGKPMEAVTPTAIIPTRNTMPFAPAPGME